MNCGLPQGSLMGPLLFILYINDLHNISPNISKILFADDTNLYISGKNLPDLIKLMEFELVKIKEWLDTNKLSLNIIKNKKYGIYK